MGVFAGRSIPASLTDGHFIRAKAGGADIEGVASGGGGLSANEVIDLVHPVGSIYVSTISTNPGTLFGLGTWTAFGAGRVMVGINSGDTDFDTVEETGGVKTHTLTAAEIPAHTHSITDPGHSHITQRYPTATGGSSGFTIDTSMSGTLADNTLPVKTNTTGITGTDNNTGGGGSHPNVQPYIVVYMWKRTA